MNLAIVGSPSFEDYARFTKRVEEVLAERGIMMSEVQVISCGADALAARYSREVLGKEPHIFTADWKQFGRSAGPKRDDQIVEAADLVRVSRQRSRHLEHDISCLEERNPGRCLPNQVIRFIASWSEIDALGWCRTRFLETPAILPPDWSR